MRDDMDNRENNYNNEDNRENETVNFELVDAPSKESKTAEEKPDYDLWGTNGHSGQAQYQAPDYGYQRSQSAHSGSGYYDGHGSNGYQSGYGNGGSSQRKNGFGKKLAKAAAVAAVFGLVAGVTFQGVNVVSSKVLGIESNTGNNTEIAVAQTTSDGTTVSTDVSKLVDNAMPSMVAITSTIVENYNYFGHTLSQEAEGSGSGIIVGKNNNQLLIVTNNHVIDGATTISVCFIDNEIVQAEVKGTDSSSDLAVVAVDMDDIKDETKAVIKIAVLGSSDELKLGQMAVAIGNALGYGQSVTVGYISALDRTVSVGSGNSTNTMNLIQTDAAINPGNSGGALLNMEGEVIGINSAKLADTEVEGIGYAIPITDAIPIINELMNREVLEENEKGYLGITGQDITDENNIYNMPTGVYVYEVAEDGAAKEAGMQQGDIITKINGAAVTNMEAVQNKVNNTKVGTEITVTVMRNVNGTYEEMDLTVTLKGYESLNSLRENNGNQNSQTPDEQDQGNGQDSYGNEDKTEEFFQEFFGDFGQ